MTTARTCLTCEHFSPCIDGAFDWDDCRKDHDIQDKLREECPDHTLTEVLMWDEAAARMK